MYFRNDIEVEVGSSFRSDQRVVESLPVGGVEEFVDAVGRALQLDFEVFNGCRVGRMLEVEFETVRRRCGGFPVAEKQHDGLRAFVVSFLGLEGIGGAGNLELGASSGLLVSGGAVEVNLDFEAKLLQLFPRLHHFCRAHLRHLRNIGCDFALVERRIVFDGVRTLDQFVDVKRDVGILADLNVVVDVVVGGGVPIVGIEGVEERVNHRGELVEDSLLGGRWIAEGGLGGCG